MTDPQTAATEAGRRLLARGSNNAVGDGWQERFAADIIAIEAEARAEHWNEGYRAGYSIGRADALREAADAVVVLYGEAARHAVLAILDAQP